MVKWADGEKPLYRRDTDFGLGGRSRIPPDFIPPSTRFIQFEKNTEVGEVTLGGFEKALGFTCFLGTDFLGDEFVGECLKHFGVEFESGRDSGGARIIFGDDIAWA